MELKKKNKIIKIIKQLFLCCLGCFVLAFGTAAFLVPANVVAGGASGIGIIINRFIGSSEYNCVDLIAWIINIICLILSFIFLGKTFAFQTLIATFMYPFFLSLIMRTNMFAFISDQFVSSNETRLLLAGIFGGIGVGAGCAITFIGNGSTGGVDVIAFIISKYTNLKQSITTFAVDATIILVGMITGGKELIIASLIGVLSSVLTALVVHLIFVRSNNAFVIDIISDKYEELNDFMINKLGRTTTILDAVGGYTMTSKKMIRFILNKKEFYALREKIRLIDPTAFIVVADARAVYGEGFTNFNYKNRFNKGNIPLFKMINDYRQKKKEKHDKK